MSDSAGSEHANDRATLKIYGGIADKLDLSIDERCGVLGLDRPTYDRWQTNPADIELSDNQIERSSELMEIYDSLLKIFHDREVAGAWLRRDHRAFGGKPPLDSLLSAKTTQFRSVFDYIKGGLAFCISALVCLN